MKHLGQSLQLRVLIGMTTAIICSADVPLGRVGMDRPRLSARYRLILRGKAGQELTIRAFPETDCDDRLTLCMGHAESSMTNESSECPGESCKFMPSIIAAQMIIELVNATVVVSHLVLS